MSCSCALPDAEVLDQLSAMTKAEQELSSVLSEFARTMLTEFPIQAILKHLVHRIVDVLA